MKHPGDSVLLNGVFNQPAISDNSKSPQDAAIRYEPAAATRQTLTNLKQLQSHTYTKTSQHIHQPPIRLSPAIRGYSEPITGLNLQTHADVSTSPIQHVQIKHDQRNLTTHALLPDARNRLLSRSLQTDTPSADLSNRPQTNTRLRQILSVTSQRTLPASQPSYPPKPYAASAVPVETSRPDLPSLLSSSLPDQCRTPIRSLFSSSQGRPVHRRLPIMQNHDFFDLQQQTATPSTPTSRYKD